MTTTPTSGRVRTLALRTLRLVLPKGEMPRKLRVGPARGCRMHVDLKRHLAVYAGFYERELNPVFRQLVRAGDACFDIGGHIGYDALVLARLAGPGGKVLSIESNVDNVDMMRRNFELNPTLDLRAAHGFVASVTDADGRIGIDELARRHFMPTFIKMDIEGGEADALRGAAEVLQVGRPDLVIETHGVDVEARCVELLKAADYAIDVIDGSRSLLRERRGVEHNRWLACRHRSARW